MPKLSIVIPCYYNEENIPVTSARLLENEQLFPAEVEFEYVLVDDGSRDGTWAAIRAFQQAHPSKVVGIRLAGNVGSYNAIVAGLAHATGDCTAVMTADLQDPPELLRQMYDYWQQGLKLVLANRAKREEGLLQRWFSNSFHWLVRRLALPGIPPGGFDLVFFDQQLRHEVVRLQERNSNVFYLLVWLGYPYVSLPYTRRRREIGKSRWTLSKKIKLLIDSLLSFSFFPIRAITVVGFVFGFLAILYSIYLVFFRLQHPNEPPGWTSLMLLVLLVAAFQMVALGVLGEYVWRGLDAARQRPMYVVDETSPAQPSHVQE
ncbi:glycosyltransferase family 2 protein [Hymenobacter busanensis]|uniref:Glycosyltransferase family 2 protein n=1 Tax=Hymenobacter busanensis TaxID=2607656 RepID=A0A7L4ZX29_9BACT|nr:glycosyltransferase family 2 protein [Hymenobacter busanensis]KAA9332257.1 glycosyltransferase family 2 protein [Hymenobacter busanensis]QHJ07406.1 glycosyltransferase [Hymenobacter busanensis]